MTGLLFLLAVLVLLVVIFEVEIIVRARGTDPSTLKRLKELEKNIEKLEKELEDTNGVE